MDRLRESGGPRIRPFQHANPSDVNSESQRWGSNPRPLAYEASALPLSYAGWVANAKGPEWLLFS